MYITVLCFWKFINFSVRIFVRPNYEFVNFIVKIKAVAKHLKLSWCLSSASDSQFECIYNIEKKQVSNSASLFEVFELIMCLEDMQKLFLQLCWMWSVLQNIR